MTVKPMYASYRDFDIGVMTGLHGYLAAWRSTLKGEQLWTEGHIYVDTLNEIIPLAKECIDFQLRIEVYERLLLRKLTLKETGALCLF